MRKRWAMSSNPYKIKVLICLPFVLQPSKKHDGGVDSSVSRGHCSCNCGSGRQCKNKENKKEFGKEITDKNEGLADKSFG